jgi:hypothetical protein
VSSPLPNLGGPFDSFADSFASTDGASTGRAVLDIVPRALSRIVWRSEQCLGGNLGQPPSGAAVPVPRQAAGAPSAWVQPFHSPSLAPAPMVRRSGASHREATQKAGVPGHHAKVAPAALDSLIGLDHRRRGRRRYKQRSRHWGRPGGDSEGRRSRRKGLRGSLVAKLPCGRLIQVQ